MLPHLVRVRAAIVKLSISQDFMNSSCDNREGFITPLRAAGWKDQTLTQHLKSGIRILGIDDAKFLPWKPKGKTFLIGVVLQSGQILGILQTEINIDGTDGTIKLLKMLEGSKFRSQVRLIMLHGSTFAGFNFIDAVQVFEETGIPVIIVGERRPNLAEIKRALLTHFEDGAQRWAILLKPGKIYECVSRTNTKPVFLQLAGIDFESASRIVQKSAIYSRIPEPIRIAHLIGSSFLLPNNK